MKHLTIRNLLRTLILVVTFPLWGSVALFYLTIFAFVWAVFGGRK